MSYSRFGYERSDVYVFEHVGGWIECCACILNYRDESSPFFFHAKTPREMLAHLEEHKKSGDNVDYAMYSIKERNEDLDKEVEPYKREES